MILCLCRAIPDPVVAAAIAAGASTLDEIITACGAGADCGACQVSMLEMLGKARFAVRESRLGTLETAAAP